MKTVHMARDHLLSALHSDFARHPGGDPDLWPAQNKALRGLADTLATHPDESSFYLHMFTGTGKTRLLIKLMNIMADSNGIPPRTIIVEPTRLMVRQMEAAIIDFMPHLADHVGLYYSDKKDPYKPIVITTHQSFITGTADGTFNPQTTMILGIDEAQEGLSEKRMATRDLYQNAVKIGLSATPDYSSDRTVANHYRQAFKLTHEDAIATGIIAPFRNILLLSDVSLDQVKLDRADTYNIDSLQKAVNIHGRNLAAIDLYKTHRDPETGRPFLGQKALFNCCSIQHAQDFAKQANAALAVDMPAGVIFCEPIWGDMPRAERDGIIQRHRAGQIMAIAQVDLLTRAYDDPSIAIAFNLAPSLSSVVVGQRGGRPLRIDPRNPEKVAYIVDIVDKTDTMAKMPLLYGEYVGGAQFGTLPSTASHPKRLQNPSAAPHKPALFANIVLANSDEVMAFLKNRKTLRDDILRKGIIADKVLPPIRDHMIKLGILTLPRLYNAILPDLPEADELGPDDHLPTQRRFDNIVRGIVSAWNRRTSEPAYEASALSSLFGTSIESLFGPPPENRIGAQKSEQPYNPDVHKHFIATMQAAGYKTIGALRNSLVLNKIRATELSNLSRGQQSPLSYMTGDFTSAALEIATVLHTTPEDLFGITLTNYTSNQCAEDFSVDQWEEEDPWHDADDCFDSAEMKSPRISVMGERKTELKTVFDVVDGSVFEPDHIMDRAELVLKIRDAVSKLDEKYRDVLDLRYDIESSKKFPEAPSTVQDVADILNIPRHMAYSLENTAIRKLRSHFCRLDTISLREELQVKKENDARIGTRSRTGFVDNNILERAKPLPDGVSIAYFFKTAATSPSISYFDQLPSAWVSLINRHLYLNKDDLYETIFATAILIDMAKNSLDKKESDHMRAFICTYLPLWERRVREHDVSLGIYGGIDPLISYFSRHQKRDTIWALESMGLLEKSGLKYYLVR